MKHCCSGCCGDCNGEISQVLKNGRKIFFCSENCKKNWQKNRDNYLAKETSK